MIRQFLSTVKSKIGYYLLIARAQWYGRAFKQIGTDVFLYDHFACEHPQSVSIGSHVFINHHVHFWSDEAGIEVGNYVMIAPYVTIINSEHQYDRTDIPMFVQNSFRSAKVVIEDDVWIGQNVIILPGVRIGKGSVIGAGAVVTKNVPPYSVMGGVPAKKIKSRLNKAKSKKK